MGLINWLRRSADEPDPQYDPHPGLDLTASRVRAAAKSLIPLERLAGTTSADLSLAVSMQNRAAVIGEPGLSIARTLPHLVCRDWLPGLTQGKAREVGRHRFEAEMPLDLMSERLAAGLSKAEEIVLAVPVWMTPPQVSQVIASATKAKLPIRHTLLAPLAVAADRAHAVMHEAARAALPGTRRFPLRGEGSSGAVSAMLIDIDTHGLNISLLHIDEVAVRLISSGVVHRLNSRVWEDKLLDAIADRCIRVCRRDPRDSADAEQRLFGQLSTCLDRAYHGQSATFNIRTDTWYQDLAFSPEDLGGLCVPQVQSAVKAVRELLAEGQENVPASAIWLTADAGRLPGLANALHAWTSERTCITTLPPEAVASAAANLRSRWKSGELPRIHLDKLLPLPTVAKDAEARLRKTSTGG